MANKRMLSKDICESDPFLDLPPSAQCLYMHLNLFADDDGFIDNARSILRSTGLSADDLELLIETKFLIRFKSGILAIKHWRIHNTLSKSRYKETNYLEEKSQLLLKDNKAYSLNTGAPLDDSKIVEMFSGEQMENKWRTDGEQVENRWRTDEEQVENPVKNSIDKSSIDKSSKEIDKRESREREQKSSDFVPPTPDEVFEYCLENNIQIDTDGFYNHYASQNWIKSNGRPVTDWKACVNVWKGRENQFPRDNQSVVEKAIEIKTGQRACLGGG